MPVTSSTRNAGLESLSWTPDVVLLVRDLRIFLANLACVAGGKRTRTGH
jgi:hypothetical protein